MEETEINLDIEDISIRTFRMLFFNAIREYIVTKQHILLLRYINRIGMEEPKETKVEMDVLLARLRIVTERALSAMKFILGDKFKEKGTPEEMFSINIKQFLEEAKISIGEAKQAFWLEPDSHLFSNLDPRINYKFRDLPIIENDRMALMAFYRSLSC